MEGADQYLGIYGHCTDFPHAQAPDIDREVLLLEIDNGTVAQNTTTSSMLALQSAVDNATDIGNFTEVSPNVTAVTIMAQGSTGT